MDYRYRVKGAVEKAFILRGMHFRIGTDINAVITESELDFVKERCALADICDLSLPVEPIPSNSSKPKKGVSNEQPKSKRAGKTTSKAKV